MVIATDILEIDANRGYGRKRIPVERDFEINQLYDEFAAATQAERDDFCSRLGPSHAAVLRAFAERMASFAVREGSVEPLRRALFALAVGGAADDAREAIMILPLIHRSAELIEAEPQALFASAGRPCTSGEFADEIKDFPNRDPHDRSLDAFGYVESADTDGFLYVRTW